MGVEKIIVSRKIIEDFIDFVYKVDAGEWDDEVVDLATESCENRRNILDDILDNQNERDYYSFLQNLEFAAQHSVRLEIKGG